MSNLPRELLKDYKGLCCSLGPVEAKRVIRQRIVNKYGHAWYMKNRDRIDAEMEAIWKPEL